MKAGTKIHDVMSQKRTIFTDNSCEEFKSLVDMSGLFVNSNKQNTAGNTSTLASIREPEAAAAVQKCS
jgi:hypothetical protein